MHASKQSSVVYGGVLSLTSQVAAVTSPHTGGAGQVGGGAEGEYLEPLPAFTGPAHCHFPSQVNPQQSLGTVTLLARPHEVDWSSDNCSLVALCVDVPVL